VIGFALALAVFAPSTPTAPPTVESPTAVAVTLDRLLERGAQESPDLSRARAEISFGSAAVLGARPLLPADPQVTLGLGGRANPLGLNFELQAQVSQRFEIAGERRLRKRAAAQRKRAFERAADMTAWTARVRIRAAYARALIAREVLTTREQVERSTSRAAEIVRARVAAGDVAGLQLRLAEGELALAEQARVAARTEYRAACRALAVVAGWPATEAIEPVGALTQPGMPPSLDTLVESLAEHPRLAVKDAEAEAARAEQTAADRDAWPEPSLGVYFAHEHEPGARLASRVALATIGVSLPLFRRNRVARAQADARVHVASTDLAVTRYELEQELRRRHVETVGAVERVRNYAEAVLPRLAENLDQLGLALELGEIGSLDVVLARQRFADMQLEALDAWGDYIDAVEALERVAGRPIAPTVTAAP